MGVCLLKLKQFKDAKEALAKCLDMIGKRILLLLLSTMIFST
jgi:hypothetical protein